MQKTSNLGNRKGFATIVLLVLGMTMFSITIGLIAYIQSENTQLLDNAASSASESDLSFIAYTMQADFYSNFLQTNFEDIVIKFLTGSTHTINPDDTFDQNLGNELEDRLSQEAQGIVSGDAAKVYAMAYTRRNIVCNPLEESGAMVPIRLKVGDDGTLYVSGLSIGQSIECADNEAGNKAQIDLQARDYRLTTRAVAIYEKAVAVIKSVEADLDETTAVYPLPDHTWRLPTDDTVKTSLLKYWNSKTRQMVVPFSLNDLSGIILGPLSLSVMNSKYEQFTADDLDFSCLDTDVSSIDNAWNTQNAQTCRPDSLQILIQNNPPENMDNILKLELTRTTGTKDAMGGQRAVKVQVIGGSVAKIELSLNSDKLNRLIINTLGSAISPKTNAYVDYSGSITKLCRNFEGRAKDATIAGRVIETNPDFLVGDYTQIPFDFRSTPLSLDTADVGPGSDDVDCQDPENKQIVEDNVKHLLTNGGNIGKDQIKIAIESVTEGNEKTSKITQDSIDNLQRVINSNEMVRIGSQEKTIELVGKVQVTGQENPAETGPSKNARLISQEEVAAKKVADTGQAGKKDVQINHQLSDAKKSIEEPGQFLESLLDLQKISSGVSGTVASVGADSDAEALSDASSTLCKLIGLNNWMSSKNDYNSLLALCGMAEIKDFEGADTICSLASLYYAVQNGQLETVMSQLKTLLKGAGYGDVNLDQGLIDAAMKSGDLKQVLLAASAGALISPEASDFLASAANLANAVKGGNPIAAARDVFNVLGNKDMSDFFGAIGDIEGAVKGRDFEGSLRALSKLSHNLGYKGLADLSGQISTGYSIYNTIANLDDIKLKCESAPWDLICSAPGVGGGICETPPPQFADCKFSYGLPTFDINLLCNDLVFDLGFQVDCNCVYTCPTAPETVVWPRSVGVNLKQIEMLLDSSNFEDLASKYDLESLLHSQALMNYCRMDP